MKLTYFGTGAYEGVPSLFCTCDTCRRARQAGGRNLRTRTQALINEDLLLDFPPDTVSHYLTYGFDCEQLAACLITHDHSDHLYPEDVEIAAPGYAATGHRPLPFFAGRAACEHMAPFLARTQGGATATEIRAGEAFTVADGRYTVLPLAASHEAGTTPLLFAIREGNTAMLYAHDTGAFPEEDFSLLRDFGHLDLVSFDCTGCALGPEYRRFHMSMQVAAEMRERLAALRIIDNRTICVLNHFSHNGRATYDDMLPLAEREGFLVSYDGMTLKF